MDNSKSPYEAMSNMVIQSIEQARGAMESYLRFIEKGMSPVPGAPMELSAMILRHAVENTQATFEHAQKLASVKDLQEFMRVQAEFIQRQAAALNDQAKEIRDTMMKKLTDASKD